MRLDAERIYAVFLLFFVANIVMFPLGFLAIRVSRQTLRIPNAALMSSILMFCVAG